MPGRLIVITGPSCVGKSPLHHAMGRLHPQLHQRLQPVVLYNDREPRPGETDGVDYHFRPRKDIQALAENPNRYVVHEVRGDMQALDVVELAGMLETGDAIYEGNPTFAATLIDHEALASVDRLSLFIAPVSRGELAALLDAGQARRAIADLMRGKLLRRTQQHKGQLTDADRDNIETRAAAAYDELKLACRCDHVVPNHDGEDSDHWHVAEVLLGDARLATESVVALIEGRTPPREETWPHGLVT